MTGHHVCVLYKLPPPKLLRQLCKHDSKLGKYNLPHLTKVYVYF